MKAVFVALALAVSALAQGVHIAQPPSGSVEKQGQSMTVVVQKQNSLTGSQDVAIAIGLASCPLSGSGCTSLPDASVGPLLFSGTYAPAADASGNVTQSYVVRVPADIAPGPARLSVAHFYILGVRSA
ncbi:hypothetical protein TRAPUB_13219 [Trametes pubescens]|uniref:Phosphatidylglycerol/phosphatidylinositol transfer protein n=1 Tax=Trametes pubescens TaxID=154538 RepID=A0A1M2VRP4_TRAPU|nr:hypothetical protein TRAPUB_13219 [Trametes pubescens]